VSTRTVPFAVPHAFGLVQENRRRMLFEHVDVAGRGLEIGPYDQPTVVKTEGDIHYLDVQSREDLVAALHDPALAAKIPEVDILCTSSDYATVCDEPFDYVIANHVLEHVPNPIAWLQMIGTILRDDGKLFLSLPDKKHTFDKYRPDTPLSHILYDYYTGVTEASREHILETELYYDMQFIQREMNVGERLDDARLRRSFDIPVHPGIHCHVFQAETFPDKILKPLQLMGLLPFELIAYRGAQASTGGEFSFVLQKGEPKVELRTEQFFTKDYEQAPPPPPPAVPSGTPPIEPAPRLRDVLFPMGTRRREFLWQIKRRIVR